MLVVMKYLLFVCCGALSAIFTFLTTWDLFIFLSANGNGHLFTPKVASPGSFGLLMIENVIFMMMFALSHSLLACSYIKKLMENYGLMPLHRSLYNLFTCFTLQLIMKNWVKAPGNMVEMWNCNQQHMAVWLIQLIQLFAWLFTCSIVYILDFGEFIGWKQILYYYEELGCPMSNKSTSARDFYQNCRHPFFLSALCILWSVPSMTFDRFLLASVFTLYMCSCMQASERNYSYIEQMYNKKINTVENIINKSPK